jgi:hypothetical protein
MRRWIACRDFFRLSRKYNRTTTPSDRYQHRIICACNRGNSHPATDHYGATDAAFLPQRHISEE